MQSVLQLIEKWYPMIRALRIPRSVEPNSELYAYNMLSENPAKLDASALNFNPANIRKLVPLKNTIDLSSIPFCICAGVAEVRISFFARTQNYVEKQYSYGSVNVIAFLCNYHRSKSKDMNALQHSPTQQCIVCVCLQIQISTHDRCVWLRWKWQKCPVNDSSDL